MLFNSFIFWIFLSLVLPVYSFLKSNDLKKIFLFLISLFFYSYWEWKWSFILLASIFINYFLCIALENSKSKKKTLLIGGITANLLLLGVFKYCNFFIENFNELASCVNITIGIKTLGIILPIGISFYTFHAIGYLMDIYRNDIKSTRSIVDFSLYMCFFPFLIAGPIVRAKYFLPQLGGQLKTSNSQLQAGFYFISIGLFQKVMIGDACGRIVDSIFYDFEKYTFFEISCAVILFSFQIYADFAGYSNIARGLGKLFGIELMQNFKQPYFSKNIKEFWTRWHISLSSWLKDYLYIPLGGNRNGENQTIRNLILVMMIGGLWHGAGWNFLLWGLYHGILLVAFRKLNWNLKNEILNTLLTFTLVTIGWFLFRINSLHQIGQFYEKILLFGFGNFSFRYIKIVISFGITLFAMDWFQIKYENDAFLINLKNKGYAFGIAFSMLVISFLYIFIKKPFPFIYFQF
ncbi:MBOAT family protein [Flavobacterium sp. H122]|uniref:MBOAT family O-acyltransferase n=1 Tax=Flavobacterium sp. H122 TaxID=2529860 RepID=UPI0010A9FCFC|nr:MBOAT family O-acyltransferase [Flavobacterium sp. H122]